MVNQTLHKMIQVLEFQNTFTVNEKRIFVNYRELLIKAFYMQPADADQDACQKIKEMRERNAPKVDYSKYQIVQ